MAGTGTDPVRVLLVEDNRGDVHLVREALSEFHDTVLLNVTRDGSTALDMLRADPVPDIILLDLNLPYMDGRTLLGGIKSDPRLRRIPVLVLTSSAAPRDIKQAYDLHANCYMVKPTRLDDFEGAIRAAITFWTKVVQLPSRL